MTDNPNKKTFWDKVHLDPTMLLILLALLVYSALVIWSASGNFMVQVGAVSDQARAQQYQQQLGQKFGVPGRVTQNGAVWRIQLGPFASKAEASTLQQRLQTEAQLQSFITTAQ